MSPFSSIPRTTLVGSERGNPPPGVSQQWEALARPSRDIRANQRSVAHCIQCMNGIKRAQQTERFKRHECAYLEANHTHYMPWDFFEKVIIRRLQKRTWRRSNNLPYPLP